MTDHEWWPQPAPAITLLLLLAIATSAWADPPGSDTNGAHTGRFINKPFPGTLAHSNWITSLRSGAATALPDSSAYLVRRLKADNWYASSAAGAAGDLVRVDKDGNVDFFDRRSLARTGGFSLRRLANVNLPHFNGPVKPSPDGKHVLAYWKPRYTDDGEVLTVFDRTGNIVQSGSPVNYEASFYAEAFDWVDNKSYLYFAGDKVVLASLGDQAIRFNRLSLPPGVDNRFASLSLSPDRRLMVARLRVTFEDGHGAERKRGVLFVMQPGGTGLRQLTAPSARAQADALQTDHGQPVWSPDGSMVAFKVILPATGIRAPVGCEPLRVVPANGSSLAIDVLNDSPRYKLMARSPVTGRVEPMWSCFTDISWIAE